jgi:hypothetical protein
MDPARWKRVEEIYQAAASQYRYEKSAAPFRRTFTRVELAALMQRLKAEPLPAAV